MDYLMPSPSWDIWRRLLLLEMLSHRGLISKLIIRAAGENARPYAKVLKFCLFVPPSFRGLPVSVHQVMCVLSLCQHKRHALEKRNLRPRVRLFYMREESSLKFLFLRKTFYRNLF